MDLTRVETQGSIWLLDDDQHRYLRMPKTEEPREAGWWDDPAGSALEDLTWHPMNSWRISEAPVVLRDPSGVARQHRPSDCPLLVIETGLDGANVYAPKAAVRSRT